MSYIDAWHNRKTDIIHVVERNKQNQRVYSQYQVPYSFYIRDNKGKYRSLYGYSLSKITCKNKKEYQRELTLNKNRSIHESDIKPIFNIISEHYLGQEPPNLNVVFIDIETDFQPYEFPSSFKVKLQQANKEITVRELISHLEDNVYDHIDGKWVKVYNSRYIRPGPGYATPSDPFMPITAVSLYFQQLDACVCLALCPAEMTVEYAESLVSHIPNVYVFDDEIKLLNNLLDLLDDVDVISTWNGESYDIPYIVNRISKVMSKNDTRRLCLFDQFPIKREFEKYGKTAITYDLIGRIHMDYLELYRKYTYEERHSYKLDSIAEYELNEKKTEYEGTLDELYHNDFGLFVTYNIQDSALLNKLDKKLKFIDLANAIAHDSGVLIQTTMGSVAVSDQSIINEAHRLNLKVPNRIRAAAEETHAPGGYVAYPKKGVHDWVGSIDLNSLYPSVFRALNMSPETLVGQVRLDLTHEYIAAEQSKKKSFAEAWENLFSTIEYTAILNKEIGTNVNIDWVNGTTEEYSAAQVYNLLFKSNNKWMITANGTIFQYEQEGIIPSLLKRWYTERKEMQAKLKLAIKDGDKTSEEYWDKRQLVKKIQLNSLYGSVLNPGSRFFDIRIGQSTTLTGRTIVKHMSAQVNKLITGEYDHIGQAILYGDTDSAYFSAYPLLKKDINSNRIEWNRDIAVQTYDAISESVNTSFPIFMKSAFHCPETRGQVIRAAREIVGTRALFITKRRYAVMFYDKEGKRTDVNGAEGKIKATGLDLRRSDTPEFIQKFLLHILEMVLLGKPEDLIIEEILKFKTEFRELPGWKKGSPKRANNVSLYTSKQQSGAKGTIPGHVAASINWNILKKAFGDQFSMQITDGTKVIVCKLKQNVTGVNTIAYPADQIRLPEWFKELPFDHNEMEKALIDNKLTNLIGVLKYKLPIVQDNDMFSTLFTFN